ncbi:MAG: transcriptional repressor [Chlorobiaceae bacterium]|nr:transcriptional repressor [Chlorobiaceae bacterium]
MKKTSAETIAKVECLFKSYMKEEKLRCTQKRLSVLREIYRSNTHLDADELFVRLREQGVGISRATVYHTLDLLFRYNLVTKIDLGHKHTHYEKSWGVADHLHIICLKCGKVSEATSEDLAGMMEKLCTGHGYSLGSFSLQLFGECLDKEACAQRVKEAHKEKA